MLKVGSRVEIPVHYDLWMQGAKFGVVKRIRDGIIYIKMNHWQLKKQIQIPIEDEQYFRILS